MTPLTPDQRKRCLMKCLLRAILDQPSRPLPCARNYAKASGVRSPRGEMETLMTLSLAEAAEILRGDPE